MADTIETVPSEEVPVTKLSGNSEKKKSKRPNTEEYHIDPEKILKYTRGGGVKTRKTKDRKLKSNLKQKEANYKQAVKQAAKSEYLLTEETGFLEVEAVEKTYNISQKAIEKSVDVSSAQKYFNLHLQEYGPYKINYTRNGKFLLLCGQKSHLATVNWNTKDLGCEIQSQESNRDACWLHQDRFFAVAHKKYVHIYDHTGSEIHVMKEHRNVNRVHYLPYHFLLTSVGQNGHLMYQDTSTGKAVGKLRIPHGRCDCLTSNPYNAVVQLGHANGTVSMWAPKVKEPLLKMLCHRGPVLSIATERQGVYMATTGQDGMLKVWDIRAYKPVYKYRFQGKASHCLAVSQKGLLAAAFGSNVYVFKDAFRTRQNLPYMRHIVNGKADITDIEFCPYEDVLGVGHSNGFTSLLIPGAGEANFDGLEVNPYESRKQKAETEVKMLLEKIQPEMISLDPSDIQKVDTASTIMKQEEKDENMEDVAFQPKHKKKGRSSSGKALQRKKGVDEESKRDKLKSKKIEEKKQEQMNDNKSLVEQVDTSASALDRFKKKKDT
ncbi:uncharacterized protein [Clytia hemisphaerica]|uniref:BING4 C-terminal domain-containing protein n=1 Tax=Clytia hemisphaerica TaxID=252671 RepID=A0A7M5XBP6_9CNID